MAIDRFDGDFRFLSNFYGEGITVEHLYQCAKTKDEGWRLKILNAKTPGIAKRYGSKCPLRPDWESIKFDIMLSLVRQKFNDDPILKVKLIDTYPNMLIEGNKWHDNYWGDCRCPKCVLTSGQNMLGIILMTVRNEILKR